MASLSFFVTINIPVYFLAAHQTGIGNAVNESMGALLEILEPVEVDLAGTTPRINDISTAHHYIFLVFVSVCNTFVVLQGPTSTSNVLFGLTVPTSVDEMAWYMN